LYYLNARYYDPTTCRFINSDSFAFLDPQTINGLNLFAYCLSNPLGYIDPNGTNPYDPFNLDKLLWHMLLGALIGAVAGAIIGGVLALLTGNKDKLWDFVKMGMMIGFALGAIAGAAIYGYGAYRSSLSLDKQFATNSAVKPAGAVRTGRQPGKTIDPLTGEEVGRFIVDPKGNTLIEPVGGDTVPAGRGGVDTHTRYPNGSNYQRLNPVGHLGNPTPHGHGHLMGTGPNLQGQGFSLDVYGNVVPWNSAAAHWSIKT